jgi:hypothetical protein
MLDEVIGLPSQFERGVKERFLHLAPAACISVDDSSAWQTRVLSLAIGLPEEDEGEEEKEEDEVSHSYR